MASETVTGATLMGVRLYDPTTGRFLSVDPVSGGSANANAYDYVYASAIDQFDIDGRWCLFGHRRHGGCRGASLARGAAHIGIYVGGAVLVTGLCAWTGGLGCVLAAGGVAAFGAGAAVEPDGEVRDVAWVAEIDGGSDCLTGWPKGIRLIVRKERQHPGAQLRFTDADGMRLTCFATNTKNTPIAELELRHRQQARAEDRIRAARATGLLALEDRSIGLTAFAIAGREHEVAFLRVRDFVETEHGMEVDVRVSKIKPRKVKVPFGSRPSSCPVRAWRAWKESAGLSAPDDFAYKPLYNRWHTVLDGGLDPETIGDVITRLGTWAELDFRPTGHSPRRGLPVHRGPGGESCRRADQVVPVQPVGRTPVANQAQQRRHHRGRLLRLQQPHRRRDPHRQQRRHQGHLRLHRLRLRRQVRVHRHRQARRGRPDEGGETWPYSTCTSPLKSVRIDQPCRAGLTMSGLQPGECAMGLA